MTKLRVERGLAACILMYQILISGERKKEEKKTTVASSIENRLSTLTWLVPSNSMRIGIDSICTLDLLKKGSDEFFFYESIR